MEDFGINTDRSLAHFLGQTAHETGGYTRFEENLNYSASGLVRVWPSRFTLNPDMAIENPGLHFAPEYALNPISLGNLVYANILGNGNSTSGDGYNFRGQGAIQLTGRSNYTAFNNYISVNYNFNVNFTTSPSLLSTNNRYSILSALWYFNNRVSADLETANVRTVTRQVNGGLHGLQDRTDYYDDAIRILQNSDN